MEYIDIISGLVPNDNDTTVLKPEFLLENVTNDEWEIIEQECKDTIEEYIEENALKMSQKDFIDTAASEIHDYMFSIGVDQEWCDEAMSDEFYEWLYDTIVQVLRELQIPPREAREYKTITVEEDDITKTLKWIDHFPVQKQRSAEWYAVRRNLFSASNLWKLFATPGIYNSLIYEKCKDVDKLDGLNSSSYGGDLLSPGSRNWGIKYEPVSVMIYEDMYKTKVKTDYGCIPHETLPIGASPDGINILPKHAKYGHMVEVKNIYNREMDGIPSVEYWTQMQIQMATCRLEYCDFIETRIKEYENSIQYYEDQDHEYKGIIMFFVPKDGYDGTSQFVYVPLDVGLDKDLVDTWFNEKQTSMSGYFLYQISYWYLDQFCCTEIERNDWWFQATIPKIKESWETVLYDRKHGCEHRAPQKKTSSTTKASANPNNIDLTDIMWKIPSKDSSVSKDSEGDKHDKNIKVIKLE